MRERRSRWTEACRPCNESLNTERRYRSIWGGHPFCWCCQFLQLFLAGTGDLLVRRYAAARKSIRFCLARPPLTSVLGSLSLSLSLSLSSLTFFPYYPSSSFYPSSSLSISFTENSNLVIAGTALYRKKIYHCPPSTLPNLCLPILYLNRPKPFPIFTAVSPALPSTTLVEAPFTSYFRLRTF